MAQQIKNPHAVQETKETQLDPWARKILLRRGWLRTPVFMPEKFPDRGAGWTTVQSVAKSQT